MNKEITLFCKEQSVTPIFQKIKDLKDAIVRYNRVNTELETAKIAYAYSIIHFQEDIVMVLKKYLNNLRHNDCHDALPLNFKLLTKKSYWLNDGDRLYQEMHDYAQKPLSHYDPGLAYYYKDTVVMYKKIVEGTEQIIALLSEIGDILKDAPDDFYLSFYRNLQAEYCEKEAKDDYEDKRRNLGIVTDVKLRSLQALLIADFVNGDTLSCAFDPSDEEREKVDVEKFKKRLPHNYEYAQLFDDKFVIFNRTVKWDGDLVIPLYGCAGYFIFQHWEELTEEKVHAILRLDKMLELVNEDIMQYQPTETEESKNIPVKLPEVLATPEAMILWKKVQDAGYVDERYQPILSRPEAALLAFEMAKILDIDDQWKAFETLWNRRNMSRDYYTGMSQKKSGDFLGDLRKILG